MAFSNLDLKVALLMPDPVKGREISSVFKAHGTLPIYYTDLEEFASDENGVDLLLVDIRAISSKEIHLLDITSVSEKRVSVAIYYEQGLAPLVKTATALAPNYLINGSVDINLQVSNLLSNEIKSRMAKEKVRELSSELERLQKEKKVEKVTRDSIIKFPFARELVGILTENYGQEFHTVAEKFFESFAAIQTFSALEMNSGGSRLYSRDSAGKKYFQLPPLDLKENGKIGSIDERLAMKMATENLGTNIIMLPIKNSAKETTHLFFIELTESRFFSLYPWEGIADLLTLVCNFLSNTKNESLHTSSIWNLLDRLQKESEKSESRVSALSIDLSRVSEVARISNNRFDWKKFGLDLSTAINKLPAKEITLFEVGVDEIILLVNGQTASFLPLARELLMRFPFNRYFESPDRTHGDIGPLAIRALPTSPSALFAHLGVSERRSFNSPTLSN